MTGAGYGAAAACCLTDEGPLATLNFKAYKGFKLDHGLRILGAESPRTSARIALPAGWVRR